MESDLDKTIRYYDENGLEYYKNTVKVIMDHLYKPFLDLIPKGGRILDAGCGSGRDSLYFSRNGYQVTAMDASTTMASLCSQLTGLSCLHLQFNNLDFVEEFNGIWACASLLHVSRKDINYVLAKLINALKVEGILYASFKHGDKDEFKNGRIFNYYNEKSFKKILDKHQELELINFWVTTDVRSGRSKEEWLNVLLRKIS